MTTEKFDLNSKKGHYTLAAAFIVLVILLLFTRGCFGGSDTTTITIPAVSGKTTIVKPESKPLEADYTSGANSKNRNFFNNPTGVKNAQVQKEAERWKQIADSLINENSRLQGIFAHEENKHKLDSLYSLSIAPKAFSKTWDDEYLKATVNGMYLGYAIPAIELDYTIKERKQEIKLPQNVFRLLGGVEVGATKDFTKINTKANLGIQNKKGNILTISADSEQRFYVGYNASIFSIKR